MQKEGIIFELLAPYLQEQNGVSERMRRIFIDMTKATILGENIENELWPELVLAMTYIKNSCPTKTLTNNLSPHKANFREKAELSYVQILSR